MARALTRLIHIFAGALAVILFLAVAASAVDGVTEPALSNAGAREFLLPSRGVSGSLNPTFPFGDSLTGGVEPAAAVCSPAFVGVADPLVFTYQGQSSYVFQVSVNSGCQVAISKSATLSWVQIQGWSPTSSQPLFSFGTDYYNVFLRVDPNETTSSRNGFLFVVSGGESVSRLAIQTAHPSATISGRVTDSSLFGFALSNVTMSLTRGQSSTTKTDGSGNYTFTVPTGDDYTVTPSLAGYLFTPDKVSITDLAANQTANFTARKVYKIAGKITRSFGTAVGGVTVTLSSSPARTSVTDASGNYTFDGVESEKSYTVTPTLSGMAFNPASQSVTALSGDQTLKFTAVQTYSVSGKVTENDSLGKGLQGVTVALKTGIFTTLMTKITDASGNYTFTDVPGEASYEVVASKQYYRVAPGPQSLFLLGGNRTGVNFTATPVPKTIQIFNAPSSVNEGAGRLTLTVTRAGDPAAAVSVDYSTEGLTASDRSDFTFTKGTLSFGSGEASKQVTVFLTDDTYVEGPENFTFSLSNAAGADLASPSSTTVTIIDNDTDASASNPLDAATFFVRQQYIDFLNREPDASGLAFWVNNILACGDDAQCTEVKRINTSAAFFLSIEFQNTGYFAYRVHRASFGRQPRLGEFVPAAQSISQGVVVNSPGWENRLELNKQKFITDWLSSQRFKDEFPASLTPAEFVDKLISNTGVQYDSTFRDSLVDQLGSARVNRASVLRTVVDSQNFYDAELNKAFVLMEYSGYLRRNPDDEPDTDFTGNDFWLRKLEEADGDFIGAEMVKAFISSREYRLRFGPQ